MFCISPGVTQYLFFVSLGGPGAQTHRAQRLAGDEKVRAPAAGWNPDHLSLGLGGDRFCHANRHRNQVIVLDGYLDGIAVGHRFGNQQVGHLIV